MKVLVDTTVWSEALRKTKTNFPDEVKSLEGLIENGDACLIGPIRQELLSGYSEKRKFNILREKLSSFPSIPLEEDDFIRAADFSNQCRKHGIQGAHTDYLICSIAYRLDYPILTTDQNFHEYSKVLPIKLHRV